MSTVLHKFLVLDVNGVHLPIDERSVRDGITAMMGESPAVAFDIDYDLGRDGRPVFSAPTSCRPVSWDEWITLPVRPWDIVIQSARRLFRAPTVIKAPEYTGMPHVRPRLCPKAVYERDNWVCQYSGRRLKPSEASLDHVIPRDRGGRDTWENLVTCDRKINSWKGNRLNSECGLKLLRKPAAPHGMPRCHSIRKARHPDWMLFLTAIADSGAVAA
jgi:5-methylcytosine-specific restriction endonuclease McrA